MSISEPAAIHLASHGERDPHPETPITSEMTQKVGIGS